MMRVITSYGVDTNGIAVCSKDISPARPDKEALSKYIFGLYAVGANILKSNIVYAVGMGNIYVAECTDGSLELVKADCRTKTSNMDY